MKLHTRLVTHGAQPTKYAVIVHGIMGSHRNWVGFARLLAQANPNWSFLLIDLRGHGDSHPATQPNTIASCAKDLQDIMRAQPITPTVAIGHSFGGKVIVAAANMPNSPLRTLVVLDTPPGTGDMTIAGDVLGVVKAVETMPLPITSRKSVSDFFSAKGFPKNIALWMTTNTRSGPDGLRWHFDIAVIKSLMTSYSHTDQWDDYESPRPYGIHLIMGEQSTRWTPEDDTRLPSSADHVRVSCLPNAAHWVHADNPTGLADLVTESLRS